MMRAAKGHRNLDFQMVLFGIVLLFASFGCFLHAQSVSAAPPKVVRVACGINNSRYLDEQGRPQGYCSEYLLELAALNHWKYEYVEGNWMESVDALLKGKVDLLLPTQKTKDRKDTMLFSKCIGGYQPIGLYALQGADIYYEEFSSFDGKRIAIGKNSSNEYALEKYAKANHFTYTPVYLDSVGDKLDAVKSGAADLAVFSMLNDTEGFQAVGIIDSLPFYYTVRADQKELYRELNDGMHQLMLQKPELAGDVYQRFLSGDSVIAYTRKEHERIALTKELVVGFYKDTAPLSDVDSKGNPSGVYIDLLRQLEKKMGIRIRLYPMDRSAYAFDLLKDGTIDLLIGTCSKALESMDHRQDFVSSEAVMQYDTVAVTKQNYRFSPKSKPRFALTRARTYWREYIESNYPGATISYVESAKDCLIAVNRGKADVTLLNTVEYNYQSKNIRFQTLMEWESFRVSSHMLLVANASFDPTLMSIVDKGINQISSDEISDITSYHLNLPYHSFSLMDHLSANRYVLFLIGLLFLAMLVFRIILGYSRRKHILILKEKNDELQQAVSSKSSFLSRMSHELRTPLNAISGYSTLVEANLDAPQMDLALQRKNIQEVKRASEYLLTVLGDILDTQTLETGKVHLQEQEIDVTSCLENVVNIISLEADKRGVSFLFEEQKESIYCITDPVRLQQILLNLLNNALKFTPTGGKVEMGFESHLQDNQHYIVRIAVKDNGIGMSQEFVDNKLFQPFCQEDLNLTSPYEGCGLGLSISRDLARLMGGDIICRSRQNQGSEFIVTLYLKKAKRKVLERRRKQTSSQWDLHGLRILMCEDNAMNQDMTKRLLCKMNCQVDVASDGERGVSLYRKQGNGYYDFVLMDIRMPHMDGLEATRLIRNSGFEDSKTLPIVALSANAFEEDIRKSLEAGMNEHMAKPVDAHILYQTIRKYCVR